VVERRVRWGYVQAQLLDEARQSRSLPLRQVEHQPRERRGVDDRMLQRALQTTAHEPGVEGVVAVLDQHGALCKTQEPATRVFEFRRPDEHRTIDMVALARIRV